MVLVKEAACKMTEPWITTRRSKPVGRIVIVNLGCRISDYYSTEEGRGDYETTIQSKWQKGYKSTVQMLHMPHACLPHCFSADQYTCDR